MYEPPKRKPDQVWAGPERWTLKFVAWPSVTAPSGPMAHSTEDLHETSLRLAGARDRVAPRGRGRPKRAFDYEATARALRTHGEACRTQAEAARKRQDDR